MQALIQLSALLVRVLSVPEPDRALFPGPEANSLLEEAKETKNEKDRTRLFVSAIRSLAHQGRIKEAEQAVGDVVDIPMRKKVADVLNLEAAEAAVEAQDWAELSWRSGRIASNRWPKTSTAQVCRPESTRVGRAFIHAVCANRAIS